MAWLRFAIFAVTLAGPATAERVTVFAAASLRDALTPIAEQFEAETGHEIVLSFAGSSVLARQITLGAPADLFISANSAWMDALETQGYLTEGSRFDLVENRLALISATAQTLTLDPDLDLIALLGGGRLAMALVQAVPAGMYGKQALEALGLWAALRPHVAQTDNVRAALALVALGEAPLGIVYTTDAAADARVHVAAVFPETLHSPIIYPAAAITPGGPGAHAFLDALQGPAAQAVFSAKGFGLPPR